MRSDRPPAALIRGVVLGVICGIGGYLAHGLGGAEQASGPVLAALLVGSIGLGVVLAKQALELDVLVAVALISQGAHHLAHLAVAGESPAGGGDLGLMLAGHGVTAVLTVAGAAGADRVLLGLAEQWWSRWFAVPQQVARVATSRLLVRSPLAHPVRRLSQAHLFGRAPPYVA